MTREPSFRLASVAGLGPHGEFPASIDQLHLSDEHAARTRAGRFGVAVVLHTTGSDWSKQQIAGIRATLKAYDAELLEVVDCNFRATLQVEALDRLVASRPNAIISIPIDNALTADAHRRVAEAGIKLVLMDNAPVGLLAGKHYVSVVSADNFGNGQLAAEILARHVPQGGLVGVVGFALNFFVTNEREIAFRKWMKEQRPDVELRSVEFSKPESAGEEVARLVESNPSLNGLFVVWDVPAMNVVRSLHRAGRPIPITTVDLGNEVAVEIAADGVVKGCGAQQPYDLGVAEATAALMALVGDEPPPWIALPALAVTRENVLEAYRAVWHGPPSPELLLAFAQGPDAR